MNIKNFLFAIAIIIVVTNTQAQYDYKFHIKGISDTTIYLANYYGGKMYYNDTARVDVNGWVRFQGEVEKPGGIYAIVFPDNKTYFEVVIAEPEIEIVTTFPDPVPNVEVKKSEENKAFYKYLHFVNETQTKLRMLAKQRDEASNDKDKEKINEQIKTTQAEAERFKHEYMKKNEGLFAVKVLRTSDDVKVPEFRKEDGTMDDVKRYWYYRAHFFDYVDMKDDRLLRTPVLNQKISTYLEKLTPQVADSVCESVNYLISLTDDSSLIYKYIIQYATNTFEKSDIMGMDAVFVCIAENYYSKNKAWWLSEEKTKEIVDMYKVRKHLIIGNKAENIILQDLDSNWRSMYDIKAKYTILVFWDPGCGHCKKEMPKLKSFYDEWKNKGVEVYAVCTEFDNKNWAKFVKENGFEWIDVSDNPEVNKNAYKYISTGLTTLNSLNFRDYWDIYSTPQFYILDENKMIIAKKLGPDLFPDFLKKYESQQR